MGLKNDISLGIVGAGNMAKEYLKIIENKQNIKCGAIYTRTYSKAIELSKVFNIEKVCKSLDDFINTKLDGVIVVVNADQCALVVKELSNRFDNILAEKPIGLSIVETEEVHEVIEKNKCNLYVALNRRFYSSTLNLLNNLANTRLSERLIIINDQEDPLFQKNMNKSEKEYNSMMFSNSVHLIDYVSLLARGEIINKTSALATIQKDRHYLNSTLYFNSGDKVIYNCLWGLGGSWSLDLYTDNKRFQLKPIEELSVGSILDRKLNYIEKSEYDINYKPGLYLILENFIQAILNKQNNSVKLSDYIKTQKVIDMIYKEHFEALKI